MKDIRTIAQQIIAREGGYVNDPDDPGGETNYGVTLATLQRLGKDITGDQRIDGQDVQSLSREQAVEIFLTHYYEVPRIALLPDPIQPAVFDMYVNSGANAVKILQRLIVDMGFECHVDGVIGPQTAAATRHAHEAAPHHFVDAYGIARRNYYYALGDRRPQSRKYARSNNGGKGGWIRRAEDFISEKYRLTLQEHQHRVRAWG